MAPAPDLDTLARSVVLRGLPRAELEALRPKLRRRQYRRGEVVFRQGDPGHALYVLVEGRLKVVLPAETGEEAILNVLGPGDVLGELALLDAEPRSATIVALEPVVVVTLAREDFLELLGRSPAAVEGVLAGLARTIRRLSGEVGDLMYLDLQARLAKKLVELTETHGRDEGDGIELQVTLTQDELAAMVGATRPRVNRLLGSFEDRGMIGRRGRRLVVLQPEALRRLVEW